MERLTDNQVRDSHPQWSPDGRRITFVSVRDGNEEIYVMNAEGSDQTRLTYNPGRDISPVWSPNGEHIAFSSMRYNKNQELQDHDIYVMNTDGLRPDSVDRRPRDRLVPYLVAGWAPHSLQV